MNGFSNGYDNGGGPGSSREPHPPRTAVSSRRLLTSPQLSQMSVRSKHTNMDVSMNKHSGLGQRGYYSDVINPGAADLLGDVVNGPQVDQDLLCRSLKKEHLPSVTTFDGPDEDTFSSILKQQQLGPTTELTTKTDFPTKAWQPKVQTPFYVPPGEVPRKIEIERGKRMFAKQRLAHLLHLEGIDSSKLMPKHMPKDHKVQLNKSPDPAPFPAFLPLEIFDNNEYDCRTPQEWLDLGVETGSDQRKPVPGKALLPTEDRRVKSDPKDVNLTYKWCNVGMLDYDKETELFLVQKIDDEGRILDTRGHPVVNGGVTPGGSRLSLPTQYWIPRVRLMFRAEDAAVFAHRVAEAYRLRKRMEGLVRYNLYIDCMPLDDNVLKLDDESFDRMAARSLSTVGLRPDDPVILKCVQKLKNHVGLDFMRTMNKLTFDNVVSRDPKAFAFVTTPDPPADLRSTSVDDLPEYDYEEQRDCFAFNCLWTRVEAIVASGKVHTECNKVKVMSLFNTTITKSMKLEEFEQTQSQAYTQVQLFLRDSWISTLRGVVRGSFQYVGKGWFNMHESNWQVYKISKLKKYMEMVKFIMQDSLRYLVQNSLKSFTQMIHDACYQVLDCPEDMVWSNSLLVSEYKPKRNPIFVIDLMLDTSGPRYSTPLENFEPALVGLFDKAIASTQHVPQLERYVLEELFWRGSALLESVGAHEPHVEALRERITHAVRKAIIPMRAYAKEYQQHMELYKLDIDEYVKEFDAQEHTAAQVKAEVDMHLAEKERLEATMPSSIVVGAFWINTENVRQSLAKKRKALGNAVLELLAKKLRNQADEACEECKAISRKLYEKPNTIEELTEMREWMKGVPEQLLQHQERIDRAMGDYELIEEFYCNLSQDDFVAKR